MSTTYNALAAAIAKEENSAWPNNPGALEDSAGNPLDFGSLEAGQKALLAKLNYDASGHSTTYSPTMSLADFESKYTGGDSNAANNIGSMLGVPTSTQLGQLSDQSLSDAASGAATADSPAQIALNKTKDAIAKVVPSVSLLELSIANVSSILIGAILIAGAVFGFSQVRDAVVSTGVVAVKAGKALATTAA